MNDFLSRSEVAHTTEELLFSFNIFVPNREVSIAEDRLSESLSRLIGHSFGSSLNSRERKCMASNLKLQYTSTQRRIDTKENLLGIYTLKASTET